MVEKEWELKTERILVFDKVCSNTYCNGTYKSPRTKYNICPDCMNPSAVKVLLKSYSDLAYDREELIHKVNKLENLIAKISMHYGTDVKLTKL